MWVTNNEKATRFNKIQTIKYTKCNRKRRIVKWTTERAHHWQKQNRKRDTTMIFNFRFTYCQCYIKENGNKHYKTHIITSCVYWKKCWRGSFMIFFFKKRVIGGIKKCRSILNLYCTCHLFFAVLNLLVISVWYSHASLVWPSMIWMAWIVDRFSGVQKFSVHLCFVNMETCCLGMDRLKVHRAHWGPCFFVGLMLTAMRIDLHLS